MKKLLAILLLIPFIGSAVNYDTVYTISSTKHSFWGYVSDPVTGEFIGQGTLISNQIPYSAAMGMNKYDRFYALYYGNNGTSLGNGKVKIYSFDKQGNVQEINESYDVNGSSNRNLGFVRLGINHEDVAYMVSREDITNDIYLTSFQTDLAGNVTNFKRLGTLNTSDNSNDNFVNGDLVFDKNGNMFVLANDPARGGITKIYMIGREELESDHQPKTLKRVWNLRTPDNKPFAISVNGVAFSSQGSLWLSAGDGVYFVDAETVNQLASGTVITKRVSSVSDISDLASNIYPETVLPVQFGNVSAFRTSNQLKVTWTTLMEKEVEKFVIEVSENGKDWQAIGEVQAQSLNDDAAPYLYNFEKDLSTILVGLPFLLAMGFVGKRYRYAGAFIAILVAGSFVACNKTNGDALIPDNKNIQVRIKEVEKDGITYHYSKVFTAIAR